MAAVAVRKKVVSIGHFSPSFCFQSLQIFFSRVLRDSTPRFVGPSARPSVRFCVFRPHCSCPNDEVTSIMAPAHPHATGVAVYPALFFVRSNQGQLYVLMAMKIKEKYYRAK